MRAGSASNTQVPGMSSYSSVFLLMTGSEGSLSRSIFALDRVGRLHALVEQRVGHAFGQAPFREDLGRLLEHARLPTLVDHVGVEVVLRGAAARAVEIPEVA